MPQDPYSNPQHKTLAGHKNALWLGWIVGVVLIILTRLPHVFGAGAVLDGDEAILALMSKHLSEGRPLELFFYGQNFGVTVVENINTTVFFLLLGVSTTSVKIATLVLWTIGWSFFLFGTRRLTSTPVALLAALLLLTTAAWGHWSTLARGYHVGGFMLCQFCYWYFAGLYKSGNAAAPKLASFFLLGGTTALLFLTQKIWFLALLPFLIVLFWHRQQRQELLAFAICAVVVSLVPYAIGGASSGYWDPAYLQEMNPFLSLALLPERVWTTFSGAYTYAARADGGRFANIAASAWCIALIFAVFGLIKKIRDGQDSTLAGAILASSALVVLVTLFVSQPLFGYRYLLPLASTGALAVALCLPELLQISTAGKRALPLAVTGLLVLALIAPGSLAIAAAKAFRLDPAVAPTHLSGQTSLDLLIEDLQANQIHHVYSLDPMLQWNIIFSSQEKVLARWSDPADRRPEYPQQVDQAFYTGHKTAIVGKAATLESFSAFLRSRNIENLPIYISGERYFWLPNPDRELLENIGFRLNSEPTEPNARPLTTESP